MDEVDKFLARLPEKITTYGGPDDCFVRMVDTFSKQDSETILVDRQLVLKQPLEYIRLEFKIDDKVPVP